MGGRILLADDNVIVRLTATAMLESLGYSVEIATDTEEALQLAPLGIYDAILIDCTPPISDGVHTNREVRHPHGASASSPVVALSASSSAMDEQRCRAAGMDEYLAKPFGRSALASILARWLERTSAARAIAADSSSPTDVGSAAPALDSRILGQLEELGETAGEGFMEELVRSFLIDADIQIRSLREAVAALDIDLVSRSAHTLSGSSANLGAVELARLCAIASTDLGAKELLGDASLLEAIQAELARVRSALADRLAIIG
jgi:CheY-like chemotaxis protein